jgi:hypothetical protein
MSENIAKLVIAYKFSRLKVADLLASGRTVLTDMGVNVERFSTPPVPLPVLKQDLDILTVSSDAALDGSKKAILQRNKDRHAVEQDLALLGAYALKVSNGDAAVLASSGFVGAAPRVRATPQPLAQPTVRSVEQGNSGTLLVTVTKVAKAGSYDVRYAALVNGIPGDWRTVTVTAIRTPVSISGLTPGTTYAFQARAVGKLGQTDWSDSATRMCI